MSHDLLSEAARTLREASDRPSTRAAETRARVLASHRRGRVRRLRVVSVVLPLAAVLVASTAWAASTGRLRGSLRWVMAALTPAAAEAPARGGVGAAATPAARAVAEAIAALAARAPDEPSGSDETAAPPSSNPAASDATATAPGAIPGAAGIAGPAPRPGASGAPSGAAPSASGESAEEARARALYSAAHHAHFASQDWGAALAGWDRYLAAAPRGAFATEARYNRALCLVRLGRASEARAALEPFARGAFGEYRRAEASRLLEALEGR